MSEKKGKVTAQQYTRFTTSDILYLSKTLIKIKLY